MKGAQGFPGGAGSAGYPGLVGLKGVKGAPSYSGYGPPGPAGQKVLIVSLMQFVKKLCNWPKVNALLSPNRIYIQRPQRTRI